MNDAKLTKLLAKAKDGDVDALESLRQEIDAADTVFVLKDDKLQVQATLEAIRYRQRYGVSPPDWDDLPTLTMAEAFAERARLDPVQLRPIRPGLWTRLWEREDGHDLVAALYWGTRKRHITDSDMETEAKVRALLDGTPWPLLDEVLRRLKADEDEYEAARTAVKRRQSPPSAQTLKSTPAAQRPATGTIAQGPGAVSAGAGGIAIGGNVYGGVVVGTQSDSLPTRLHKALSALLSDGELRTLLFDLGVDYDDLRGEGKSAKALEAVQWFKRRRRLRELAAALERANYSGFQSWFPEGNPF